MTIVVEVLAKDVSPRGKKEENKVSFLQIL